MDLLILNYHILPSYKNRVQDFFYPLDCLGCKSSLGIIYLNFQCIASETDTNNIHMYPGCMGEDSLWNGSLRIQVGNAISDYYGKIGDILKHRNNIKRLMESIPVIKVADYIILI